MSYVVRFRGGPRNREIAEIPKLDSEIFMITFKTLKPASVYMSPDDLYPEAMTANYKYGVYSRVYTPMKNGQYIYVWVEQ